MTKEQVEAFGLGRALGEISVSLNHIARDVTEVKGTVQTTSADVSQIKVTLAEHAGKISQHDDAIAKLEQRPDVDYVRREEHEMLRAEVAQGRLTWGKLLGGVGALGGVVIGSGALLLNWANSLGAFNR